MPEAVNPGETSWRMGLLCWQDRDGLVDPGWTRQGRRDGELPDEAFGVSGVGRLENVSAVELNGTGAAEVDVSRGLEAQTRLQVLVVVLMRVILSRSCKDLES